MKAILTIFAFSFLCLTCKDSDTKGISKLTEIVVQVPTVVCEMCVETIKKAVFDLEGVKSVEVDLESKTASVKFNSGQTNIETIEVAISNSGYNANDKKRNQEAYASLPECCKKD